MSAFFANNRPMHLCIPYFWTVQEKKQSTKVFLPMLVAFEEAEGPCFGSTKLVIHIVKCREIERKRSESKQNTLFCQIQKTVAS